MGNHEVEVEVEVEVDHDLRRLLQEAEPRDFPVKVAWRAVIQGLRQRKRETGEAGRLGSRAAVERALSSTVRRDCEPVDLVELKRALRAVVRSEASPEAAARVDALVARLLPVVATGPVTVDVRGWPEDFGQDEQARLLRRGAAPPLEVDAEVAAALVREFDGFVLAGRRLSVRAGLAEGEVLPPVPRSLRAKPMRRDRDGPWLPHWDEVGRTSLTPRALAERQARRVAELGSELVIDGYSGLGGNAVAFAEAGLRVIAVELDSGRAELARRNAEAMDVSDRIDQRTGDIVDLLPSLQADATLFLDPPWEGLTREALPLPVGRPLALKLPRDFDVRRLPGHWQVHYEFGEGEDDREVVRMLTALRS